MAIRIGNIKVIFRIAQFRVYFSHKSRLRSTLQIHYKTSPIFYNDSVDPNLSYFCPNGKPRADWYVSQICPDEHLKVHRPPLVYDLIKDPYERYALEETDFVLQMRALAANILREHRETLVPVPSQLGHFDKSLTPCCDPPACLCDKISNRKQKLEEQKKMRPMDAESAVTFLERLI
ncbi:hypothetical protein OESDEN_02117 [Oesophagostomum dentatum]|uniref:Sulfatase N-terminal domain-containing protein n=1 Tax=Oesophagostomum dentatum TaxID=61180 RepID=A0A0B1TK09_OESDE|nr:hypothetical protein OESDEN_02117 [Oesophagostomum dentatum]